MTTLESPTNSSLSRGLSILSLIQSSGRLRAIEVSETLGVPLSTVYRYITTLRSAGYIIEVDGYLLPSERLTESGGESEHLVRYAEPVLRRLRDLTNMSLVLAVRIHTAAVCLEASFAHPKHKISFQRGQTRPLYAGASALPLLAFAPPSVRQEVLDSGFRTYTSATPSRAVIDDELDHIRTTGFAVSFGHLTPGMCAVGVPVIVDGRCLCTLSMVGESPFRISIDESVSLLREGVRELLARMSSSAAREAWLSPDQTEAEVTLTG